MIKLRINRTWAWVSDPITMHTPIGGQLPMHLEKTDVLEQLIFSSPADIVGKWVPIPVVEGQRPERPRSWSEQQRDKALQESADDFMERINQKFVDGEEDKRRGTCKKCNSQLGEIYCTDETCPYHDWPQNVILEDLQNLAFGLVIKKYGDVIRKYPRMPE